MKIQNRKRTVGRKDSLGKKEEKTKLKFQGRKRSKRGMASMILATAALLCLITAAVLSGMAKGAGGVMLGYIGIAAFVVAVVGLVLGLRSLKEPDILYFQPIFGIVLNGLLALVLISLYLIGLFL